MTGLSFLDLSAKINNNRCLKAYAIVLIFKVLHEVLLGHPLHERGSAGSLSKST